MRIKHISNRHGLVMEVPNYIVGNAEPLIAHADAKLGVT